MLLASTASAVASFFVPLIVFLAVILLAGMVPVRQRTRGAAVAAEIGAHAASWIMVAVYAAIWIPRARKIFQDFGIELSTLSMLIIQVGDLMANPVVMLIVSASMLLLDGIIYSLLWEGNVSPAIRNRFSLFATLIPAFVMLLFGAAVYVPLFKLVSAIQ
jgi:hypothetical protein